MADSPPPGLSLADLFATARAIWAAFVVPSGVSLAGCYGAYRWWRTRRDQADKRRDDQTEQTRALTWSEQREFMKDQSLALREERESSRQLEMRLAEVTGYWIEARHAANNLRTQVNAHELKAGVSPTKWRPWSWDKSETT